MNDIFPPMGQSITNTIEALSKQVADLTAERDEFKGRYEFLLEPQLHRLNMEKNPFTGTMETDIQLRHPLVPLMAGAFADLLKDVNAPNFFTMEFHSLDIGPFELTIQRLNGKPMAQIMSELKARAETAEAEVARLSKI